MFNAAARIRESSALIVMLLLAGTASAQERPSLKWPILTVVAASAVDEISTEYNLSQGHNLLTFADGSQLETRSLENNPMIRGLQGNRPAMFAVSAALTTAGILGFQQLAKHGHPKLAKAGMYLWSAARLEASIGNFQAGSQHRRYKRMAIAIKVL